MLKHEDNPDTLSQTAAQVRVTPEELAMALSRIEARKDTDQRRADGTIPIGEAVQQLGLGVTPEEVLAEVQAARAQQAGAQKKRPPRRRLALLISGGMGLVGLVGWWSIPHSAVKQSLPAVAVFSPAPQAAPVPIILQPDLLVKDASDKLVMLSEVADNQPVKCFFSDAAPCRFLSFSLDPNPPGAWSLIKHDGQVYVRGWIPRTSTKALVTIGTDVSGDVSYTRSQSPVPVTLPISGFQVLAETGDSEVFHAVNIHPDKYAYEKWKP